MNLLIFLSSIFLSRSPVASGAGFRGGQRRQVSTRRRKVALRFDTLAVRFDNLGRALFSCRGATMFQGVQLALVGLLAIGQADADLIARAERTELLATGKPVERVEKDPAGNIVRLRLDGMTLSADEFAALGRLATLSALTLNKTNVTASDLRRLQGLARLEGIALNSTELGDDAVSELVKFPALRWLCLGNVAITPAAIARLQVDFQSADRRLSLGYSRRKP
jgi:hypothetical protein